MAWNEHPGFVSAREMVSGYLAGARHDHLGHERLLVLLCGGQAQANRRSVKSLIETRMDGTSAVFMAENAFEQLAPLYRSGKGLLLAEIAFANAADAIVVLVESAGSIAELGAFASNDELAAKLHLVLAKKYRQDKSFINEGPVARVMAMGGQVHWGNFEPFLPPSGLFSGLHRLSGGRHGRYSVPRSELKASSARAQRWLMAAVDGIVRILNPCPEECAESLAEQILAANGSSLKPTVTISILVAGGMLERKTVGGVTCLIPTGRDPWMRLFGERSIDQLRLKFEARRLVGRKRWLVSPS